MQMILFTGMQASGKSEFYKRNFYKSHIRINLDMLHTRRKEEILVEACLMAKQAFVVDNTNLTAELRSKYIELAKKHKFEIVSYYLHSDIKDCEARNNQREGKEKVHIVALRTANKKLEVPTRDEGFDKLYKVIIVEGGFEVVEVE